ncbi:MAG: hypothetical protein LBT87_03615, partial [Treponema sp.]|nr:hypothetical protein [Treponema sp.]
MADKIAAVEVEGRKHPSYYAFQLYGWMPIDRRRLSISGDTVEGFASSDDLSAGILLWNSQDQEKEIKLVMREIPGAIVKNGGRIGIYRVDTDFLVSLAECCPRELHKP